MLQEKKVLYNDERVNPLKRYNNYKHTCNEQQSLKIYEAKPDRIEERNTVHPQQLEIPRHFKKDGTTRKKDKEADNLNNTTDQPHQTYTEDTIQ